MGNSIKRIKEEKLTKIFMDARRNFGVPSGQIVERDPITPTLFMLVGMRVGTITAYYEHVSPVTTPVMPTTSTNSQSVIKIQTLSPAEQTIPLTESIEHSSLYEVPKALVSRKHQ